MAEGLERTSGVQMDVELGEPSGVDRNRENRAPCRPLLLAALKGDWPTAEALLSGNPDSVRARITKEGATVLHIAVIAQRTTFIEKLLIWIGDNQDALGSKTTSDYTALHYAAQSGIFRNAEKLVQKYPTPDHLPLIPNSNGDMPLNLAAYQGHAKIISYLLPKTPLDQLTPDNSTNLLNWTIQNDLYDIALNILGMYPTMATAAGTESGWRTESYLQALIVLARKPFLIGSESDQLPFWKTLLKNSRFKGIYNKGLKKTTAHPLVDKLWEMVINQEPQLSSDWILSQSTLIFEAAKVGNVEFIIIIARSYPELLWQLDGNNMSIFHFAIKYRHENVFNLIYEIGNIKDSLETYYRLDTNENMLHLVGELPHSDRLNIVSGAALQMQRELLWFKEVEKIVPQVHVNKKNSEGQTPKEKFIDKHKNLQKAGEKWMKDTANYCMLVATLIATVIFAAAFTVPGGSNQTTGTPIFLRRTWFMIFFISDAIALCSSSTSIVIFLSILTSRYTEEDFLKSLPSKLVFGLATLFISMALMMVAFSATCFLVYTSASAWVPTVVITSASIPITMFVLLHRKLWVDTLLSTYKSRFLFRPNKHRLF